VRTARLAIDGQIVVPNLLLADSLWLRMRGLLGRSGLAEGSAMLLQPCRSIHMLGMRFPIDVVFLSRDLKVTRVVSNVRPGQFVFGGRGAHSSLEMGAGWFDLSRLGAGTQLEILF
jgi:uncharacterized membrane protein (UPF0127 family)